MVKKKKKSNNICSVIMIRRLIIFGILSIFSIGYFFVTLFGYTYNFISLKNEENKLNQNLVSLQNKKDKLKIEIQKLNDPDYIARYAKENYLYSQDGEYVLKIDSDIPMLTTTEKDNNYWFIFVVGILILCIFIINIKKRKKING